MKFWTCCLVTSYPSYLLGITFSSFKRGKQAWIMYVPSTSLLLFSATQNSCIFMSFLLFPRFVFHLVVESKIFSKGEFNGAVWVELHPVLASYYLILFFVQLAGGKSLIYP